MDYQETSYLNDINLARDSINNIYSHDGAELYRIIKMDLI